MKPLTTNSSQLRRITSPSPEPDVAKPAVEFVPLDDFLQVLVVPRQSLRGAVRTFLSDHCTGRKGLNYIAGRGKLIAELAAVSEQTMSFGDVVKHACAALHKSEYKAFREMDSRELARVLCIPAVDFR